MALSQEERRELLKLKEQGKSAFELKAALGAIRLGQTPRFEEKIAPRKTFLDNRLETIKETAISFKRGVDETAGDVVETVTGVGGEFKEAGEKIYRKAVEKDRNLYQKGVGIGSEVFRGGSLVLGDVVTGVAKTLVPQEIEEKVAGKLEEVAEDIGSTEFVQGILTKYESLDPETKRQVDNVLGYTAGLSEIIGLGAGSKLSKPILRGIKETVDEALPVVTKAVAEASELAVAKGKAVAGAIPGTKEAAKEVAKRGIEKVTKGKVFRKDTITGNLTNDELLELSQPRLTTKQKVSAMKEQGVLSPGLFEKAAIKFNKRDQDIAQSLSGLGVNQSDPLGVRFDKIFKDLSTRDASIKKLLKEIPTPFNKKTILKKLNEGKSELDLLFAGDALAENTYNKVVERFMKELAKGKNNLSNLHITRQKFDQLPPVRKLLESQTLGENTKREIILAVRKQANEYLADTLKDLDFKVPTKFLNREEFLVALKNQHLVLEGLTNIAEKNAQVIGKNKIDLFLKKHPVVKSMIGPSLTFLGVSGAAAAF